MPSEIEVSKPLLPRWLELTFAVGSGLTTLGGVISGIVFAVTDATMRKVAGWTAVGCLVFLVLVVVAAGPVLWRRAKRISRELAETQTKHAAELAADRAKHAAELKAEKATSAAAGAKARKAEDRVRLLLAPFDLPNSLDVYQVRANGHAIVIRRARTLIRVYLRLVNCAPVTLKVTHATLVCRVMGPGDDRVLHRFAYDRPVTRARIGPGEVETLDIITEKEGPLLLVARVGSPSIYVEGSLFVESELWDGTRKRDVSAFAWASVREERSAP